MAENETNHGHTKATGQVFIFQSYPGHHVTFPCYGVGGTISTLHGALHELCSLEWVNVPLEGVVLSGTLDESLRLVCALPVTSHRSVVVDLDSVIY